MPNDPLVQLFGEKIVAQMRLGKSYQQAYANVVGQAIAEKFVDGLVEAVKVES